MTEIQNEFFDIVTQVRTHLELQRALGVSVVETFAPAGTSPAAIIVPPAASPAMTKEPAAKQTALPQQRGGLAAVREDLRDCTRCKLCNSRKTIVFGEGNPEAALVFIGEGPGKEEDEQGTPFTDATGRLLNDIIVKGMKLKREDVYLCTIVKCRLPENRNPDPDEIEACEQFLVQQLEAIKPKIVVALGNSAKILLKTNEKIEALRGKWQKYRGVLLMPTLHPADLLKNPADKKFVWEDIKKVIAEMEKVGKR